MFYCHQSLKKSVIESNKLQPKDNLKKQIKTNNFFSFFNLKNSKTIISYAINSKSNSITK